MSKIIDITSDYVKQWLCDKGYSVEIREEKDTIKIKHKEVVKAEIVYFLGPAVCYFVTEDYRDIKSCDIEKHHMSIMLDNVAIIVVSKKEGNISFSIGI